MATSSHLSVARTRLERLLDVLDPEKRPAYDRPTPEKRPDPILALALHSVLDAIEDSFSSLVEEARMAERTIDGERLRSVFQANGWTLHIADDGVEPGAGWEAVEEAYESGTRVEA